MRRVFGFVLLVVSSLAALAIAARGQAAPFSVEPGSCFGFSFGTWTPPLDWNASGHEGSPANFSSPLAAGGREWAAAPSSPSANGTMMIFPSWWPVGVMITLPERALALGDTAQGRATALVANGTAPSTSAVRAWRIPCGAPRGGSTTAASAAAATAPTANDRIPIGSWRGTSTCLTRHAQSCGSDSVVYRIAAIAGTPDSASLAVSALRMHRERPTGELRCRYDAASAILSCDAPGGILRLAVRANELGGRLTRGDGVDLRYVHVRRTGP
jgi:hypothetical protein